MKALHIHNGGFADSGGIDQILKLEGVSQEKISRRGVGDYLNLMGQYTEANKPDVIIFHAQTDWTDKEVANAGITLKKNQKNEYFDHWAQGLIFPALLKDNTFPVLKDVPVIMYGLRGDSEYVLRDPILKGVNDISSVHSHEWPKKELSNVFSATSKGSNYVWGAENRELAAAAIKKLNKSALGRFFKFSDGAKSSVDGRQPSSLVVSDNDSKEYIKTKTGPNSYSSKPNKNYKGTSSVLTKEETQYLVEKMTGLKPGNVEPNGFPYFTSNFIISADKLKGLTIASNETMIEGLKEIAEKRVVDLRKKIEEKTADINGLIDQATPKLKVDGDAEVKSVESVASKKRKK